MSFESLLDYLDGFAASLANTPMLYWWISGLVTFITVVLSTVCIMRKRSRQVQEVKANEKVRFRKRDKVEFYAKKVLRKGRDTVTKVQNKVTSFRDTIPAVSRSGRRLPRRERMLIMARRVFGRKKPPSFLIKKDLPSALLEADNAEEAGVPNLPDEVLYLLQSVKVFGHFEKGVFLHLCRHMETLKLDEGELLFEIGQEDKWMYVVQEGHINLYIRDEGVEVKLSEFTVGESLHSLLSILDVLTGHANPYKTVYARAHLPSTVIRLPVEAFRVAFEKREWSLVQMTQVIMTRLQRVTFLALHNYLGLSQELLKPTRKESLLTRGNKSLLKDLAKRHNSRVDIPDFESSSSESLTQQQQQQQDPPTSPSRSSSLQTSTLSNQATPSAPINIQGGGRARTSSSNNRKSASGTAATNTSVADSRQIRFSSLTAVVDGNNDEVFFSNTNDQEQETNKGKDDTAGGRKKFHSSIEGDTGCCGDGKMVYELDEPEILDLVTRDLCSQLAVEDEDLLKKHIKLLKVCSGHQLVREGDQEVALYLVVTGKLRVFQSSSTDDRLVTLFVAETGQITGQLAVLTGEPSFFGATALIDSVIGMLTRDGFHDVMRSHPQVVLNTAHTVMLTVSPFVRQIDFALDWLKVEAGKSLYKQDSTGDCMYIILHGRLRSVYTRKDGKKELVSEYGRGEIVGMNEALSEGPRTVSMHAVRDTELAKMPEGLVKHIRRRHPTVVTRLIGLASDKLLGNIMSMRSRAPYSSSSVDFLHYKPTSMMGENNFEYGGDVSNHLANLSTVAILPATRDVPLHKFAMELNHALTLICDSVLRLHSDLVRKRLGVHAFDSVNEYRLSNWLASSEDSHRIVLYQTDYHMSPWTQRCIRQADAVLIVALGEAEPKVGELESQVEAMAVRALKMLVLLHRPGVKRPTRTVEWLNCRSWLTDHTHVQGPARLFARTRPSRMDEYWEKLRAKRVDRFSDFSRLARFLTGTSVALVLGGGGARGLSQLGIIRSMLEKDIPIDMIGGTSIGSFVGGLWAAHRDLNALRDKMVMFSLDMGSVLSKLLDLTYPLTSMFSGASFNKAIYTVFEDIQIEDLWIPYFNITTDITSSQMRVHTDGWLWRYVRASMSLSGYLPPICDPKDGHLLMDGGYVNNLPGDVARARGAYKVIAVDVGSENEVDFTNYGDYLSGWWLLWKRFFGRFTGRIKIPDMNDIQSRLSYISSCYLLEKVRRSEYCFYVRPPVERYKTLEFNKHVELIELGLEHGQRVFTDEWSRQFWEQLRGQLHNNKGSLVSKPVTGQAVTTDVSVDLSAIVTQKVDDVDDDDDEVKGFHYEPAYESSPEMNHIKYRRMQRMTSEPCDMHKITGETEEEEEGVKSDGFETEDLILLTDRTLLDKMGGDDKNAGDKSATSTTVPRYKHMRRYSDHHRHKNAASAGGSGYFDLYSTDDDEDEDFRSEDDLVSASAPLSSSY